MQVIFLHHSSFLVEIDDKVLIFDYFDGNKVNGYTFKGKIPEYAPDTKIYMFASHSHKDHYDMDVLRLADKYENIKYIFSKDIRISPNFLSKHGINPKVRDRVTFVVPDKDYDVDGIKIKTLRSTDTGVAFYVNVDGVTLFQRIRCIDLPMLASQIKLMITLAIINSLQIFDAVFILTKGGPGTSTMVPAVYMYEQGFSYRRMGYCSALGTILFLLIMLLTVFNNKFLKNTETMD